MSKKIEIVKIEKWEHPWAVYDVECTDSLISFWHLIPDNFRSGREKFLIPEALDELDAYKKVKPILDVINERLSAQVDPERTEAHEGEDGRG